MLADQRVLGPLPQILRQLEAAAQQQVIAAVHLADGNAEVDDPLGVGVKDVAEAAAAAPELLGDPSQLAVAAIHGQRCHVAGQQKSQIARIAGVAHARLHLDAVKGEKR